MASTIQVRGDDGERNPYKPMTEKELYAKLEQSRKHALEGKYRDADKAASDMRERYGL